MNNTPLPLIRDCDDLGPASEDLVTAAKGGESKSAVLDLYLKKYW